jgi:hypothetical protein
MRDFLRPLLLSMAGCFLLAGCGFFGSGGHNPASGHPSSAAAHKAVKPGTPVDPDMVAAVAVGKTRGPVDLRFALRQHPMPGQSSELDLSLIPSTALDRVTVTFGAEDGLELRDGADMTPWNHAEPGVSIAHSLTIVPKTAGIFYVSVTILAETSVDSSARVFTIPVIAGGGMAADEGSHPDAAPVARAADAERARTR